MGSRQEVFKLEQVDQLLLNDSQLRLDHAVLYREYIISQILLKYKDKDLRFDAPNRQFIETVESEGYDKGPIVMEKKE
jgi:hypothetical protein